MRWRLAGVALVAVAASIAAAYLALPYAVRGLVRAIGLALNACVWLAASISDGADAWTIVRTVVGAAGGALASPGALATMAALVLVGALALYGLQRLLGMEEESSR
jgi:hypothetical protein